MSAGAQSSNLFLGLYSSVKRTGLLEIPPVKRMFYWAYFQYKRRFEDPFADLAAVHPEYFQNGNVIDVGANVGYTALVFAKVISPGYQIFAFEPDKVNFESLKSILRGKKAETLVVPVFAAVGEKEGNVELWINENHHADHRVVTQEFEGTQEYRASGKKSGGTVSVPMHSVDSFLAAQEQRPVSFIKIDVQGFELPVCWGMAKTLEKNPNAIVAFEYGPEPIRTLGFKPEALLAFFRDRNWNLYRLERNAKITPFPDVDSENCIAERGYIDLIASSRKLL
jgi:FkbM family methyltransferase